MLNKIKIAHEIINRYSKYYDVNFITRLEKITGEAEFAYNDTEINRIRSYAAEIKLKKLELELDTLLKEAENKKIKK